MRASKYVGVLGLAVAVAGCRSGGKIVIPDEGNTRPALAGWVGQNLVLRSLGERSAIVMKPGEAPKGTCDVAVRVTAVDPVPSGVQFALEAVGRLRIADGATVGTCKLLVPRIAFTLKPADAARPDTWRAQVEKVLQTPEAYLAANGRKFDLAASTEAPKSIADPSIMASEEARRAARRVTAWPKPLFAVEPAFAASNKKIHHEGEVAFEAVIGADGRLSQAKVTTSLDADQTKRVVSALSLWRFEPAREADRTVAARFEGRTVLRIY